MYDTKTARWMVQDPLAEKYYPFSAYNYYVNNPVIFVDPDGKFVISKELQEKYPNLTAFLKDMLKQWQNKSEDFKNAFYTTSGLNEQQTIEMLTFGQGPIVNVLDISIKKPKQGETLYRKIISNTGQILSMANVDNGVINLDCNNTVKYFEEAKNAYDKISAKVLLESTLYHEGTHYGNLKMNKTTNGKFVESGKEFEKRAYGIDISFHNYKKYYSEKFLVPHIKYNEYVKRF